MFKLCSMLSTISSKFSNFPISTKHSILSVIFLERKSFMMKGNMSFKIFWTSPVVSWLPDFLVLAFPCMELHFDSLVVSTPASMPLWKLTSRNRVAPVSIQGGVQHGITFTAISTIPAASSPISGELSLIYAELSPIPATLSQSLRRLAVTDAAILIRQFQSLRNSLNIVKNG